MRNLLLAFGLTLFSAVTAMAVPSQPQCKFQVLSSGRIAFTKACTSDEKRLLPEAVKAVTEKYTLKRDLKSAMRSAQGFYSRNCSKVVGSRKATSRNWLKCYDSLPSTKLQQQMMIPSISLQTYVWEVCSRIKGLDNLADCAEKAATDADGKINTTIFEIISDYRTLKAEKEAGSRYIKHVTGGCKLSPFGKLKCAGSAGSIVLILFYTLMGWVGRIRSVLVVVLAAIGCLTASVAEGACTPEQLAFNYVGAQYGVLYPCAKEEAPSASKLDVKASIRAYFESKRYTKRLDENPDRLNRVAAAFEAVYGNEPLEVQKLALAICLKETGCGFSEAYSYKIRGGKVEKSHQIYTREIYMSKAQACGIIQVATHGLKGECARLNGSFEYAFKAQLNWLKTYWNKGIEDSKGRLPKVDLYNFSSWQKKVERGNGKVTTYYVYRYNGGKKKAWKYGRIVMEQIYPLMIQEAGFGWIALLVGLFRRRKDHQGQGDVSLTREEGDWQKRAYPVPKWGGHNLDWPSTSDENPFQWVPEEEPSPTHCPGCGQEGGACFSIVCGAVYSPDSDED